MVDDKCLVTLGVPDSRNIKLENAEGEGHCFLSSLFFDLTGFKSIKFSGSRFPS